MEYGIMFFSSNSVADDGNIYRMLFEATKFADEHGFCCIWTPERHFHEFGGQFPNPSVVSAALASQTSRLQIRSGSLISPLHHAVRIAEEWAVVDNISNGRTAISFGSGWNANDFVFFPERYEHRQQVMYDQIDLVRKLWAGGTTTLKNSFGKDVTVRVFPKPVQAELPIWVTTSGNIETYKSAGRIGANLLTHMIVQDLPTLEQKIKIYREAREEAGFDPKTGVVSLMLHTFLGEGTEQVKAKVRQPFREYIRTAVNLEIQAAQAGGTISGGFKIDPHNITPADMEALLDITFERYFKTRALMGTTADCKRLIWDMEAAGVNEIACLIDFMDDTDAILNGLTSLDELREATSAKVADDHKLATVNAFLEDFDE